MEQSITSLVPVGISKERIERIQAIPQAWDDIALDTNWVMGISKERIESWRGYAKMAQA